jgi:hypothetical protein
MVEENTGHYRVFQIFDEEVLIEEVYWTTEKHV